MTIHRPTSTLILCLSLLLPTACATVPDHDEETPQNILKPVISVPLDPDEPIRVEYILAALVTDHHDTDETISILENQLHIPLAQLGDTYALHATVIEGDPHTLSGTWFVPHTVEFHTQGDQLILQSTSFERPRILTIFPGHHLRSPYLQADFHAGMAQALYRALPLPRNAQATTLNALAVSESWTRRLTAASFENVHVHADGLRFDHCVTINDNEHSQETFRIRFAFTRAAAAR